MPDFRDNVKRELAHLSGYHCAFQPCGAFTGGPAPSSTSYSTNLGQAAHIEGARSTSARHNPIMTNAQRRSVDNGIWLCLKHARMIDVTGSSFTTPMLKRWKSIHQTKMKLFQEGLPISSGAVTRISITNIFPFLNNVELSFGKHNILYGINGVGKTTICNLMSSFGTQDSQAQDRLKLLTRPPTGKGELDFFYLKPFKLKMNIDGISKNIKYFEKKNLITVYPRYFNFLYFESSSRSSSLSLWQELGRIVGLAPGTEKDFVTSLSSRKLYFFKSIRFDATLDEACFLMDYDTQESLISTASGAEWEFFLLECAFHKANIFSKVAPTIMIIEQKYFSSLDKYFFNILLKAIKELEIQVFLILHALKPDLDYSSFDGWELYRDVDYDRKLPVKARMFNSEDIRTRVQNKLKKT